LEDNEANAQLMQAALRQRPDLELQVCERADEAMLAMRTQLPDLILLDMHLPDADGEQILAALQADAQLRRVPVVVISADAMHERVEGMLHRGVTAYLTKPLVLAQVLNLLDRLLGPEGLKGGAWQG
jgi:CheY-like chemotaxis protein